MVLVNVGVSSVPEFKVYREIQMLTCLNGWLGQVLEKQLSNKVGMWTCMVPHSLPLKEETVQNWDILRCHQCNQVQTLSTLKPLDTDEPKAFAIINACSQRARQSFENAEDERQIHLHGEAVSPSPCPVTYADQWMQCCSGGSSLEEDQARNTLDCEAAREHNTITLQYQNFDRDKNFSGAFRRGYVEQGHAALKDEPQETQYNLSTALRAMVHADALVY
ncbi:hypothetical protein Anapl_11881 [Anas platyrhynchos]|uniref:Uncharacterized protein n=1 Tax=Anas platyrhynchos TaxID=8839 RepID=R0K0C5_ANAPL|nr:hypothetical protein Anapl_11881 [Anas platyrhynchos]